MFQNVMISPSPLESPGVSGLPHNLFHLVDETAAWTFSLLPGIYTKHTDIQDLQPDAVYVLEDSLYSQDSHLVCYGVMQRLDDLLRAHPHHLITVVIPQSPDPRSLGWRQLHRWLRSWPSTLGSKHISRGRRVALPHPRCAAVK